MASTRGMDWAQVLETAFMALADARSPVCGNELGKPNGSCSNSSAQRTVCVASAALTTEVPLSLCKPSECDEAGPVTLETLAAAILQKVELATRKHFKG